MAKKLEEIIVDLLNDVDLYEFKNCGTEKIAAIQETKELIESGPEYIIDNLSKYSEDYTNSQRIIYEYILKELNKHKPIIEKREIEYFLENGTFIKESIMNKLGSMEFNELMNPKLIKKFMEIKGNSLFNCEGELCFLLEYNQTGLTVFSYKDKKDRSRYIYYTWKELEKEVEDMNFELGNYYTLDGTPFGIWSINKLT